jgi:hypothetical protein
MIMFPDYSNYRGPTYRCDTDTDSTYTLLENTKECNDGHTPHTMLQVIKCKSTSLGGGILLRRSDNSDSDNSDSGSDSVDVNVNVDANVNVNVNVNVMQEPRSDSDICIKLDNVNDNHNHSHNHNHNHEAKVDNVHESSSHESSSSPTSTCTSTSTGPITTGSWTVTATVPEEIHATATSTITTNVVTANAASALAVQIHSDGYVYTNTDANDHDIHQENLRPVPPTFQLPVDYTCTNVHVAESDMMRLCNNVTNTHTNRNDSCHKKKDCDNGKKDHPHPHHVILMQHSHPTPESNYDGTVISHSSLPAQDLPVVSKSMSMSMPSSSSAPFESASDTKTTAAATAVVVRVGERRCPIDVHNVNSNNNNNEAEAKTKDDHDQCFQSATAQSRPPIPSHSQSHSPLGCQTTIQTTLKTATTPPLHESLSGLILTTTRKDIDNNDNADADAAVTTTTLHESLSGLILTTNRKNINHNADATATAAATPPLHESLSDLILTTASKSKNNNINSNNNSNADAAATAATTSNTDNKHKDDKDDLHRPVLALPKKKRLTYPIMKTKTKHTKKKKDQNKNKNNTRRQKSMRLIVLQSEHGAVLVPSYSSRSPQEVTTAKATAAVQLLKANATHIVPVPHMHVHVHVQQGPPKEQTQPLARLQAQSQLAEKVLDSAAQSPPLQVSQVSNISVSNNKETSKGKKKSKTKGGKILSPTPPEPVVQVDRRKRRKSMRLMSTSSSTNRSRNMLDQDHHGEVQPQPHSPLNMGGLLQSQAQSQSLFPSPELLAMTKTVPRIPGVLRRRYRYSKQQPQQLKHFTTTKTSTLSSSPSNTSRIELFVKKAASSALSHIHSHGSAQVKETSIPDLFAISQSCSTTTETDDIEEDVNNMHIHQGPTSNNQNQNHTTGQCQSQSVSVSRLFPTPEDRTAVSKKLFGFLIEEEERLRLEVCTVGDSFFVWINEITVQ